MPTEVTLQPVDLRWVDGAAEVWADLCAHGDFLFRIGEDTLSDGLGGRDLAVSTAALYLLRTLEVAHTKEHQVGDHLFPCCGFVMYDTDDTEDALIVGCPSGEDFEVEYEDDGTGVVIRSDDGREWCVAWPEWRRAVFSLADRVSEFYASCASKQPSPDDAPGFRKFLAEWDRRRGEPLGRGGDRE